MNIRFFLAVVLFALCSACIHPLANKDRQIQEPLVLIFDAGSTGTRVYVYTWEPDRTNKLAVPALRLAGPSDNPWVLKKQGGLANLAKNTDEVSGYLDLLTHFLRERIPAGQKVPAYFYATGGVRKLEDQDEKALLAAVQQRLKKEPFIDLQEVRELTGSEEGVYTWIAVNALSKRLGTNRQDTLGVIELGGASMQIVFEPLKAPSEGRVDIQIGGHQYALYAHSYDGVGREEAFSRLTQAHHENFCFSPELKPGPGAKYCIGELMDRLDLRNTKKCADNSCAMRDVYQPPLRGEFVGIENFSHVGKEYGNPHSELSDLIELGDEVCSLSIQEYKSRFPKAPNPDKACFDLSFLRAILAGDEKDIGLGFNSNIPYRAVTKIQNIDVSWSYGAALQKVLALP